jgi:hypothetical protein
MKTIKLSLIIISVALPMVASAARLQDLISSTQDIVVDILIPSAFGLCLMFFFWGIAKYIRSGAGSETAATEGRRIMVGGVIGIFVVFSIWGIIKYMQTELDIPNTNTVVPVRR